MIMKYRNFLAIAALSLFAACHSSRSAYRATDVTMTSSAAQTTFSTQYPNASDITWTDYDATVMSPMDWSLVGYAPLDASARLVHFSQDNQNYYVLYDAAGMRVASAYVLTDFNTLPSAVNSELQLLYPAYTVNALSRVTLNDNRTAYEVELKKLYYTARVLIDDNGRVIDTRLIVSDHI